ncbi:hypothetical protein [Candidatus Cardinium hertigii]|uniref:Uncharacterized protein n=1 Tax=Candidatus Cardinium hertigii TaxID=247481 RepID=A0A3N2QDR0_9BACT|nr:hypothetical protein [Candidatus Cardinium hertigii]ROT47799.1 hypothetical protein EDM02_00450 [Candidatus Cardinium hertigii]
MSRYTFRYLKLLCFFIAFIWLAGQSPAQANEYSIYKEDIDYVDTIFNSMDSSGKIKPGCSSPANLKDDIDFIRMICQNKNNQKNHNDFINAIREEKSEDSIAVLAYLFKEPKSRASLCSFFKNILRYSDTNAFENFKKLADELCTIKRNKTSITFVKTSKLNALEKNKRTIALTNISAILGTSGAEGVNQFIALFKLLFKEDAPNKYVLSEKLRALKDYNPKFRLSNISTILQNSGKSAAKVFEKFLDKLVKEKDGKYLPTAELKAFKQNKVEFTNFSSMLRGAGSGNTRNNEDDGAKAFEKLFNTLFVKGKDGAYIPSAQLNAFQERQIEVKDISSVLIGSGSSAAQTFKDLFNELFEKANEKYVPTAKLKAFEEHSVKLRDIFRRLHKSDKKAVQNFKELFYQLFFKEENGKYVPTAKLNAFKKNLAKPPVPRGKKRKLNQTEGEMLAGVANLDNEENNEKENMYGEEEEIENIYGEEEEAMEVMKGNG